VSPRWARGPWLWPWDRPCLAWPSLCGGGGGGCTPEEARVLMMVGELLEEAEEEEEEVQEEVERALLRCSRWCLCRWYFREPDWVPA